MQSVLRAATALGGGITLVGVASEFFLYDGNCSTSARRSVVSRAYF